MKYRCAHRWVFTKWGGPLEPLEDAPGAGWRGRLIAWGLILCFAAGHLMHAWYEARYDVAVTSFTRYLPLYFPLRDTKMQVRLGLIDRAAARERGVVEALARHPAGELQYPLHPLTCSPAQPLPNVLLIVIDAMRADALNPQAAPHMSEFARGATRFNNHYSGGNASRAGMFSIFYGVPATYWDAFAGFASATSSVSEEHTWGLALNGYLSSHVKVSLDFENTWFEGGATTGDRETEHAVLTRVQYKF